MPTISNSIETLEGLIVTRLQPIQVANIAQVTAAAQTNAAHKSKSIDSLITVSFMGETFSGQKLTFGTSQDSTISIEVAIQACNLRTVGNAVGVYDLIGLVKQYLLGYTPPAFSAIIIKSVDQVERTDTVFMTSVMIETTTLNVQKTDAEIEVLLQQITDNIYNEAAIVETVVTP
jgi:hypothetical protein